MAEDPVQLDDGKTVYNQDNVFVHTSVPASTHFDNIIRGNLRIVEKANGAYIDWSPDKNLPSDMEFEVQSYLSGDYEWGVVSKQPSNQGVCDKTDVNNSGHKYRIHFKVTKLHSIRRSDPKLAWPYAVFILKDGTTQPALHFHSGGITAMISRLQRYIWITRASTNQKLFVVEDVNDALGKPLHQHKLFDEEPEDTFSKIWSQASGTLQQFSKVTRLLMDTIGPQGGLEEHRPISPAMRSIERPRTTSNGDQGFEILSDRDDKPDLGPKILTIRGQRLQPEEWCAFMDNDGRIKDVQRLKERIFRGGIHEDIRKEAWKFLLGYFPFDSTYEDRVKIKEAKTEEYFTMKKQWETMSQVQIKRFSEFASRRQLVDKDSIRTDKTHQFYGGENNENTKKLSDMLKTYCMYNFDLGYVQGMSDLLSPILILMEDEVDSFWCFCGLMESEANNFEIMQHFMQTQLENLGILIKFFYPNFYQYLESKESGNLFFCFRWLLLTFKREFSFENTMILWEVLWTQTLTPYFKLFIALAILEGLKDDMMSQNFGFNEILKHINEMSYKLDLPTILERAESLALQAQRSKNIPDDIIHFIKYPEATIEGSRSPTAKTENTVEINIQEDRPSSNATSCVLSQNNSCIDDVETEKVQQTGDEVVELCEDTKSVF